MRVAAAYCAGIKSTKKDEFMRRAGMRSEEEVTNGHEDVLRRCIRLGEREREKSQEEHLPMLKRSRYLQPTENLQDYMGSSHDIKEHYRI